MTKGEWVMFVVGIVTGAWLTLLVGCGTPPGDFTPDQTKWIIRNVH